MQGPWVEVKRVLFPEGHGGGKRSVAHHGEQKRRAKGIILAEKKLHEQGKDDTLERLFDLVYIHPSSAKKKGVAEASCVRAPSLKDQ